MMNRLLRFLATCNRNANRLFEALFGVAWYQTVSLVVALVVAGVGYGLISPGVRGEAPSFLSSFVGPFIFGAATSVFASAMVVKLFASRLGASYSVERDVGVDFFGHIDDFEAVKDWRAWIRQTPRGASLIAVGEKHSGWFNSWNAILDILKKGIGVELVFMGSKEQIASSLVTFIEELKKIDDKADETLRGPNLRFYEYETEDIHNKGTGFYWNGRQLLVKLYLASVKNEHCPIIALRAPGVSGAFEQEDFSDQFMQLKRPKALMQAARAFGYVLGKRKALPYIDPTNPTST